MSRCQIIAECATAHGGDLSVAEAMIHAAQEAGADWVKFQTYRLERLHPRDPQADWLRQAHLDRTAHERLIAVCAEVGIRFLSTPFDADSLQMLRDVGLTTFKIASSESGNGWWDPQDHEAWFVSWPWGEVGQRRRAKRQTDLTAVPLYPTPLEAVGRVKLAEGWSCHVEGTAACLWAIANDCTVVEVHLTIPGARCKPWDKTPEQIRQIRDFADAVATMRSGVNEVYRTRWRA